MVWLSRSGRMLAKQGGGERSVCASQRAATLPALAAAPTLPPPHTHRSARTHARAPELRAQELSQVAKRAHRVRRQRAKAHLAHLFRPERTQREHETLVGAVHHPAALHLLQKQQPRSAAHVLGRLLCCCCGCCCCDSGRTAVAALGARPRRRGGFCRQQPARRRLCYQRDAIPGRRACKQSSRTRRVHAA